MLSALVIALAVGCAIGAQATLINRSGKTVGTLNASLLINLAAGTLAALVLVTILMREGFAHIQLSRFIVFSSLLIGLGSILTIYGFAYSLQTVGVTATLTTIIIGQLLVGTIVDMLGWGGADPLPFDIRRLAGLLVLGLGLALLLPEQ